MPIRNYPLHYYNDDGWLKIPVPLWIVFLFGLQHLWFFAPAMHKVMPEIGELIFHVSLLGGDALVAVVLMAAGHRMGSGGLDFMRALWRRGWLLLVAAYLVTIVGFGYQQSHALMTADHRNHFWALLVMATNGLLLGYLLVSRHSRDVFAFNPRAIQGGVLPAVPAANVTDATNNVAPGEAIESAAPSVSQVERPSDKPAIGLAIRERQAREILARYPITEVSPQAEREARARLEEDLENAQLWNDLGIFCLHQGRLAQATDFVRQSTTIDGANPLYLRNLAELARQSGLSEEALASAHAAVRLAPQDPEAHFNLGVVQAHLGRTTEAIARFQHVLSLNESHQAARANLAALSQPPQSAQSGS